MELSSASPIRGHERASRLGLTSDRYQEHSMSHKAESAIDKVKKKDRPEQQLADWSADKLYLTDATRQLFNCPEQLVREDHSKLSAEEFVSKYEKLNLPCIITGVTDEWRRTGHWTFESFYRRFKYLKFKVGEDDDGKKLRVQFKDYLEYLVYNKDDSPLYLFESSLEDREEIACIIRDYSVPQYFRDDLLGVLGDKRRPPYRWFLIGPERSGTTVHIDPLCTSAWNASLIGHKRWVLFGEHVPKSVVKGKEFRGPNYKNQAINYFVEILPKIKTKYSASSLQIIEFIQRPGEVVFVPGGWWHAVINLDDTMAVTQNFMSNTNFDLVWKSIRVERRKLATKLLEAFRNKKPDLYQRATAINTADEYKMQDRYERQSVSMSFSPSSDSSSSSSSSSEWDSSKSCESGAKSSAYHSKRTKSLQRSRQESPKAKRVSLSEKRQRSVLNHE